MRYKMLITAKVTLQEISLASCCEIHCKIKIKATTNKCKIGPVTKYIVSAVICTLMVNV